MRDRKCLQQLCEALFVHLKRPILVELLISTGRRVQLRVTSEIEHRHADSMSAFEPSYMKPHGGMSLIWRGCEPESLDNVPSKGTDSSMAAKLGRIGRQPSRHQLVSDVCLAEVTN